MQIAAEYTSHAGFPVLYVSGELDGSAEALLADRLDRLVEEHQCAMLHVNDVGYTDANSVMLFLRAKDRFAEKSGALAFVCCQAEVLRVLNTLGLLNGVDVFDDMDEAAVYLRERCPQ